MVNHGKYRGNMENQWDLTDSNWRFHIWSYLNSWMVFVRENPNLTWMMTSGTPIYGNFQVSPWLITL